MKTTLSSFLFRCLLPAAEDAPESAQKTYQNELSLCRKEHGGGHDLPEVRFFLFGMGARTKLIYHDGSLIESTTEGQLHHWNTRKEIIVHCDHQCMLGSTDGARVMLREYQDAVWLEEGGKRTALKGNSICRAPTRLRWQDKLPTWQVSTTTWESKSSQAYYEGIKELGPAFLEQKILCAAHLVRCRGIPIDSKKTLPETSVIPWLV